jgi:hypothetical protein
MRNFFHWLCWLIVGQRNIILTEYIGTGFYSPSRSTRNKNRILAKRRHH